MSDFSYIHRNLLEKLEEIETLALRLGTDAVRLVAVTKSASDEELCALAGYGASDIAENRPQELVRRATLLEDAGFHPHFHQIGHLQTNKVGKVLTLSPLVHSLDSLSLLTEIERVASLRSICARVLIEVNSAREENKSGILPEEVFSFYEKTLICPHIQVVGLMTMGPVSENEEDIRPYFRATKKLLDTLVSRYEIRETPILSMGMSDSYRVAIEEGSTLVRIGRALFVK